MVLRTIFVLGEKGLRDFLEKPLVIIINSDQNLIAKKVMIQTVMVVKDRENNVVPYITTLLVNMVVQIAVLKGKANAKLHAVKKSRNILEDETPGNIVTGKNNA